MRGDSDDGPVGVEIGDDLGEGRRVVRVRTGGRPLLAVLDEIGDVPLPPYISGSIDDPERYQTVYSRRAARPPRLRPRACTSPSSCSARVRDSGVEVVAVDLAVGLDTFRPITAARLDDHVMHTEQLPGARGCPARAGPRRTGCGRGNDRRAVPGGVGGHRRGVRAGPVCSSAGRTRGRIVDALMTNFHMPCSTLLCLLDAFVGPRWRVLYATALEHAATGSCPSATPRSCPAPSRPPRPTERRDGLVRAAVWG